MYRNYMWFPGVKYMENQVRMLYKHRYKTGPAW